VQISGDFRYRGRKRFNMGCQESRECRRKPALPRFAGYSSQVVEVEGIGIKALKLLFRYWKEKP